jgi:hypothetical protein
LPVEPLLTFVPTVAKKAMMVIRSDTMATEQEYDEIIAPMLAEVARKVSELGMNLIARVEWEPGESGITQIGDLSSIGQFMTHAAAHSHGNIDKMCLHLIKHRNVDQSMFLHSHNQVSAP